MNKNRIIAGMLSAVIVTGTVVGIALSSQNNTNSEVEPTPTPSVTAEPTEEPSEKPSPTSKPQITNTPVPQKSTKIATPVPAPYIVRGQVYDGLFNTQAEAGMYADKELINKVVESDDGKAGYYVLNVEYSDGTWKYTIQWY